MLSGNIADKKVEVLRDTGCSGVIIRRELVDEADFTGDMGHIMTVDCTLKRAPMAKIEVDTPFYVGTVEALCLQDPLFDSIIGNVPGARKSDNPNSEWGVVTAEATRAQARSDKDPKPLKMQEVADKMSINKKDLIKMQEEDVERGRIEKTATPGRRNIPGEPRGETQVGCGGVQGGHPQAIAVGQLGTNLVGVKSDVAEEISVNEEDLLGLLTF